MDWSLDFRASPENSSKDNIDLRFLTGGVALVKEEMKISECPKAMGNFKVYPKYVLSFEFTRDADEIGRIIAGLGHNRTLRDDFKS